MEWYYYVLIAAVAVLLVVVLITIFGGKEADKPKPKPIVNEPIKRPEPLREEHKDVQTPMEKQKLEEKPKVAPAPVEETAPNEDKNAKYHVSQNKNTKSARYKEWRVRKEGSNKTIKYFQTQKEAIEYAESLAESAGSSMVIHKTDGSIRKQNYSKKD